MINIDNNNMTFFTPKCTTGTMVDGVCYTCPNNSPLVNKDECEVNDFEYFYEF
jgi:hypothetical protein